MRRWWGDKEEDDKDEKDKKKKELDQNIKKNWTEDTSSSESDMEKDSTDTSDDEE